MDDDDLDEIYLTLWQNQEYDPLVHGSPSDFLTKYRLFPWTKGQREKVADAPSRGLKYELAVSLPWIFWLMNWNANPPSYVSLEESLRRLMGELQISPSSQESLVTETLALLTNETTKGEKQWKGTWLAMESLRWLDRQVTPPNKKILPADLISPNFAAWRSPHSPTLTLPLSWNNGILQYRALVALKLIFESPNGTYGILHHLIVALIRHEDDGGDRPIAWPPEIRFFVGLDLDEHFCDVESRRVAQRFPLIDDTMESEEGEELITGDGSCLMRLKMEMEETSRPFEIITFNPASVGPSVS